MHDIATFKAYTQAISRIATGFMARLKKRSPCGWIGRQLCQETL